MAVQLAFYKADGDYSNKLIRKACSLRHGTPVRYSHVEYVITKLANDSETQIPAGLCVAASKRDDGLVRSKYIMFKENHWDFMVLEKAESITPKLVNRIGNDYDVMGMLLCPTPWARLHPNKDFCSGMIAEAMGWENPGSFDPHMVAIKMVSLGTSYRNG